VALRCRDCRQAQWSKNRPGQFEEDLIRKWKTYNHFKRPKYLHCGIDAIAPTIRYFDLIPVGSLARLRRIVWNIAVLMNVLCEMAHEMYFGEVELGFRSQDLVGFRLEI
jgi:hypothetical protein